MELQLELRRFYSVSSVVVVLVGKGECRVGRFQNYEVLLWLFLPRHLPHAPHTGICNQLLLYLLIPSIGNTRTITPQIDLFATPPPGNARHYPQRPGGDLYTTLTVSAKL